VRGSRWIVIGAVVGVAMALGGVPFLAGAARSLAATSLRLVEAGGRGLVRDAASAGAPRRVVLGITAVVAVVAPGVTAWLLVLAARGTLRLRAVVAVLIAALGAVSFAYHPGGVATGDLLLALAAAAIAVVATGPLVAGPLALLAGLIGGTVVPALVLHGAIKRVAVQDLHVAIYDRPGTPLGLAIALVVVALVPFALALRGVLRR
jgi:hypothetical protein